MQTLFFLLASTYFSLQWTATQGHGAGGALCPLRPVLVRGQCSICIWDIGLSLRCHSGSLILGELSHVAHPGLFPHEALCCECNSYGYGLVVDLVVLD